MPGQIRSVEEFRKLVPSATECRVVRRGEQVKLKLRTPKALFVYVTNEKEADAMLKDVKVSIVEF